MGTPPASNFFIKHVKNGLQLLPARKHTTCKHPKHAGSPMRQQMEEDRIQDGKGEDKDDWKDKEEGEMVASLQAETSFVATPPTRILAEEKIVIMGVFPHLEEGKGLNVWKAQVKKIVWRHGGTIQDAVSSSTNLLILG
jgi:hypothetical protein